MKKQIDILAYLGGIVKKNTTTYQSDFDYDVKKLRAAAQEPKAENRTFYWMSRPCGTWCFLEREVFLRDSEANVAWTYYDGDHKGFRTFRVCVTGIDENGAVIGDIFPFDYAEQVQRVERSALPIYQAVGEYEDGTPFIAPGGKFVQSELYRHGGIRKKRYEPKSESELSGIISLEHYTQEHPPKRRSVKNPPKR